VTDSFVTLRGVDGAGLARQARGPVTFQLTGIGSGPARRSLVPGWTLPVTQGTSGAFISYGIIAGPSGRQSRPTGPRAWRASPAPSTPRRVTKLSVTEKIAQARVIRRSA